MADILITGGVLIALDPQRRIIADGAVAITGDRIVAAGPTAEVTAQHSAPTTIDARGKAILPGLIDGHAHAGHGMMKTIGGGRSDHWYQACEAAYTIGSTERFWHAEAQLAALERIRFGVTTGVSLLGGGDSVMRTDEPAYAEAHCSGAAAVGGRSVVAIGPTRPPHPMPYARWQHGRSTQYPVSYQQQLATCRSLIASQHGANGGRTRIALITPTLRPAHRAAMATADYEAAIAQGQEIHALAGEHGLVFTQDGHGRGSVAMAHEFGLLGPSTLLSHATGLTDEEIQLCAATETRIAHNPSAVASILARCPATELMQAGVVVCLGSDATAPDRSADMFRHMQQCMHYHRTHFHDPSWLPPGKVLEMCTIDAAKALGMDDQIGSIEPGKQADIILVDLRRPHLYPAHMPEFRVVYFANGNDVDTVLVAGRIVLQNRQASLVDENAVLDAAQQEADLTIDRLGLRALLDTPATFWGHVRATDQPREA
jgi:cytosine/adenosine deaminase-related metal-dependent hydrolase